MNARAARACAAAQREHWAFIKRSEQGDLSAWVDDMQQRCLEANTIRQLANLVRAWLGHHMVVALVQDALLTHNAQLMRWKRVESDLRLHGIDCGSGYE